MLLNVKGEFIHSQPYIFVDGEWRKCETNLNINNEWTNQGVFYMSEWLEILGHKEEEISIHSFNHVAKCLNDTINILSKL